MSPLVRKEVRLLLPFLGIALFLAAVPSWIIPEQSYIAPINPVIYWAFGFGVVLLGLAPFGQELSLGTFPSLLAQPLQRNRIWFTKLLLISAAGLLALLVFVLSIYLRLDSILGAVTQRIMEISEIHHVNPERAWRLSLETNLQQSVVLSLHSFVFWRIGLMLVLVGLAGGVWTTLLFRQTGAALWSTILVPGIIFVCVDWFLPANSARQTVFFATFAIYSIAGIVWARRMFLAAQDTQWLGGTISLSGLGSSKAQAESVGARRRKPLRALLRKEFQSQQINLLIAFGLLVLHLCTLASRGFYEQPRNSQLRFVLEAIPYLWFLLPWLLGSAAVAEERKLGTLESQLCLPAMRRLQFAVKFCLVIMLGILLGAVTPWIVERIGLLFHVSSAVISTNGSGLSAGQALFLFCQIAAAIAFLSFFASTLTRNTLQALGVAVLVASSMFGLLVLLMAAALDNHNGQDDLFLFGLPALFALLLRLSYTNFKYLTINWRLRMRNAVLFLVIVFAGYGLFVFVWQIGWVYLRVFF